MTKSLNFTLLSLYCAFIYWLSDQPTLPVPDLFSVQDKVLHAGAYFIMAVLAWRGFKQLGYSPIILVWLTITFCSLYGVSDEWHQSFVEGRTPDVADWLADTVGAGLAAFLAYRLTPALVPINARR
ncbi:MAG: VanZ family protein [Methylobacter sp.]